MTLPDNKIANDTDSNTTYHKDNRISNIIKDLDQASNILSK